MPAETSSYTDIDTADLEKLSLSIKAWADELGFQQVGIADIDLSQHEEYLQHWLKAGYHGEMDYMQKHGSKRSHPEQLVEDTCRIISVRMDYMPPDCELSDKVLADSAKGFISRYALGRDYHKLMRNRLQKLADRIKHQLPEQLSEQLIEQFGYRVFVDSAPVLEKALAEKAGLGWIGKHSNLINQKAGSWFFLGEIYTNLPLPLTEPDDHNHCGTCTACIDVCPTQAIVAPYQVDARRCISYLTIELHGSIPPEFRKDMGNRIYGCDDCQLCCPWNRFSQPTAEKDFFARHPLDAPDLLKLFAWDEETFLKLMEGSAIRRIGHRRWLRNISVALGNCTKDRAIIEALEVKKQEYSDDEMLVEHFDWAIKQQLERHF